MVPHVGGASRPPPVSCTQVPLLQGKRHTWYAGAYTLFNTHEIATMSGKAPWAGTTAVQVPMGRLACARQFVCDVDKHMRACLHGLRRRAG